jgi:hypothetical protein
MVNIGDDFIIENSSLYSSRHGNRAQFGGEVRILMLVIIL